MTTEGFAPAKINLTLHVTGRRADGYHLLDSLVAFADVGDHVSAAPGDGLGLKVTGPQGAGLAADASNLVLRAARFLDPARGAALTLDKHLPVASGIGGGSSDAAAALRVLARLWDLPLPDAAGTAALGADVPVCLAARACRMSGIGERLADAPKLPPVRFVLVNPGVAVPTAKVFGALRRTGNQPMPGILPAWPDAVALAGFLRNTRNDLEAPAIQVEPAIGTVLRALRSTEGCLMARMSGSGATCFGLYADTEVAERAASVIRVRHPDWWVAAPGLFSAG